jgi:hypothetical protein
MKYILNLIQINKFINFFDGPMQINHLLKYKSNLPTYLLINYLFKTFTSITQKTIASILFNNLRILNLNNVINH